MTVGIIGRHFVWANDPCAVAAFQCLSFNDWQLLIKGQMKWKIKQKHAKRSNKQQTTNNSCDSQRTTQPNTKHLQLPVLTVAMKMLMMRRRKRCQLLSQNWLLAQRSCTRSLSLSLSHSISLCELFIIMTLFGFSSWFALGAPAASP